MVNEEKKEKLELVAGFVSPEVKRAIRRIAKDEQRTVSQVVRIAIEQSPIVKAAIEPIELTDSSL